MKAIFYSLSIVTVIAAAVLTSQGKSKFQEQQTMRIDAIQQNKRVSRSADETSDELKQEKETLTQKKTERAELEESVKALESTKRQLEGEIAAADRELKSQADEVAAAEEAKRVLDEKLAELGLQGTDLKSKLSEMKSKKDGLVNELDELDTNVEGARGAVAKNRSEIARLSDKKAERAARIRANSMESVITAVDQNWGFVVIGAGRSSGFEPQKRLIVKRDGRLIAEVTPSAIEASQTIAEIDFDTLAAGVRLQPGDRVLIAKPATN